MLMCLVQKHTDIQKVYNFYVYIYISNFLSYFINILYHFISVVNTGFEHNYEVLFQHRLIHIYEKYDCLTLKTVVFYIYIIYILTTCFNFTVLV